MNVYCYVYLCTDLSALHGVELLYRAISIIIQNNTIEKCMFLYSRNTITCKCHYDFLFEVVSLYFNLLDSIICLHKPQTGLVVNNYDTSQVEKSERHSHYQISIFSKLEMQSLMEIANEYILILLLEYFFYITVQSNLPQRPPLYNGQSIYKGCAIYLSTVLCNNLTCM